MPDLSTSIREYYDAVAEPVDVSEILKRSGHRRVVPNWAVAVAAGLAVFVLIGGFVWLISGTDSEVIDEPMPTVVATTTANIPDETPVSVPDTAPLIKVDPALVASSLPVDATKAVAVGDGSLWAWTDLGIVRWNLEDRNAELFGSADGLPVTDGASGGIVVAPDGTVWAFTSNQGLARFDGTRWSEPAGYDQLDIVNPRCVDGEECLNSITAMAVGPDGVLSLAFREETLLQLDGTEWNVVPVTSAEVDGASVWATDMAVAADGTLWVASWEELLAYDGDEWDRFTAADGLPSGKIDSVAVAPNGDIWIKTIDPFEEGAAVGVARFDGDLWTVFDENDGLYESATAALTVGPDGTVWVVHGGAVRGALDDPRYDEEPAVGAVSRFDGTTWSSITIADVGWGFGWGGAAVDDTGTLWITSRLGIVGLNGSEATVLRVPGGIRPGVDPSNAVAPDVWDPILSTTAAKAAPAAATCPEGSDPDNPGIVDQARPNPGYAGNQAAAFDRHTGRIVYVDSANETWTFDVCTNTWEQMNPIGTPERYPGGLLVYDADSDRVISVRASSSSVYDPNANTWTRISDREAMPGDHPTGSWMVSGAVYDPVSGLVLAQHDQLGIQLTVLSAYDVDTDRWTRVGALDGQAWRNLIGYSTQTDQLIFAGYGDGRGSGTGDDTGDRNYTDGLPHVVDPRTGSTLATGPGAVIIGAYSIISYAADTDTAYVQTQPNEEICWFDPETLTWDNCFEGSDYPADVARQGFSAMVGDPINNRLVLINPHSFGQSPAVSAVWAVDFDTGQWTQLLAPPTP